MRYLGILTLTFVLTSPAAARKHHPASKTAARQKLPAPPEPTQPAAREEAPPPPAPVYANAQSDDDEVPGKKHKK